MMKGRLPHFILRFKRPAAPALEVRDTPGNDEARSLDSRKERGNRNISRDSSPTTDTEDEYFDTSEGTAMPVAKLSYSGDAAARRASSRKSKQGKANHASTISAAHNAVVDTKRLVPTSITLHPPAPPGTQVIGKRKRDIPRAIGGGKGNLQPGDLQPPKKTPRRQTTTSQCPAPSEVSKQLPGKPEEDKRVLRSQDTTKKSEYEEWFEPKEDEFDYNLKLELLGDAPVQDSIQPDNSNSATAPIANGNVIAKIANPKPDPPPPPPPPPPTLQSSELITAPMSPITDVEIERIRKLPIQTIDLEDEARNSQSRISTRFTADPLVDDEYIIAHRAEERGEKRLRNIERELLAHNVQKMEQDLDKLQGPEWTKAIGLGSSVLAKASRRELEERKERLIGHLEGIIGKHKTWKEEERRRKLGLPSKSPKTSPSPAVRIASEDAIEDNAIDEDEVEGSHDDDGEKDHRKMRRRRYSSKSARSGGRIILSGSITKPPNQSDAEPFTSFYRNPHLRQRAVGKYRGSARTQTAFGELIPVLPERDFELPVEIHSHADGATLQAANG